jgi:hypothetical protein
LAILGIEKNYDFTPRVCRRIVHAASQHTSCVDASQALAELGELQVLPKRLWRTCSRGDRQRGSVARVQGRLPADSGE